MELVKLWSLIGCTACDDKSGQVCLSTSGFEAASTIAAALAVSACTTDIALGLAASIAIAITMNY
jgi:hypothetical protein